MRVLLLDSGIAASVPGLAVGAAPGKTPPQPDRDAVIAYLDVAAADAVGSPG